MAWRNRTSDFMRLRDDHTLRRGGRYKEYSTRKTLLDAQDMEMKEHIVYLPPDWIARVTDIQYEITTIRSRLHDLSELHKSHLLPGFHDRDDEEHSIEVLTSEITKMFHKAQKMTKSIGKGHQPTNEEKQLQANIQSELARELQDLTINFRQAQKNYLSALRSRQKKIGQFSTLPDLELENLDTGFTAEQMQRFKDKDDQISQREKDVIQIAKSIQELAEIFNDLNMLVIDQGTILDRIDYNIEQSSVHIDEGYKELVKANTQQKKMRTKYCILLLVILILVMVVVVIMKALF
jgi:syntaxin 16